MTARSNSPDQPLPERLRHFTDRDEAIAAFEALWPGDGVWALAFHGLSGNGKSTLIDFLIETRCKPGDIGWAILDFEGSRGLALQTDWRGLLDSLAQQWGLATHPTYTAGRELARREYEAIRQSLQVRLEQKAEHGQITTSPITIDAGQGELLRQANGRARHQTAAALLEAAAATHTNRRLALFLDTYELMAQAADKEYTGWLWRWLGQAAIRLPGLRVIVGSREELAELARRERRQEALTFFNRTDSDQLLQRLKVTDPAWRAAVFERLAGGHPLLTEMAADLWREAQTSGHPLPAAEIPQLAGQERAVEWLTGRILDRLEQPLKAAVRWAALLRRFDQECLAAILPDQAGQLADDDFDRLRRYSFVAPARLGQGWACHDLLRRVQNAYLRTNKPTAQRQFHNQAAAYFAAVGDEVETLYHALMAGDETAPKVWVEATHAAYLRLDWPTWAALLAVTESPELVAPRPLQAESCFWRGQWHRWRYDMDEALASYQQALGLFRAVGARLGEANTLQAIGDVQQFRKEMDEALASYQQALGLFRAVGSRLGEANTLLSLGDLATAQQEWDKAKAQYEQALRLYQTIDDRYSIARAYYTFGNWHAAQNQPTDAATCYRQAIKIFSAIGLSDLAEQIIAPRLEAVTGKSR